MNLAEFYTHIKTLYANKQYSEAIAAFEPAEIPEPQRVRYKWLAFYIIHAYRHCDKPEKGIALATKWFAYELPPEILGAVGWAYWAWLKTDTEKILDQAQCETIEKVLVLEQASENGFLFPLLFFEYAKYLVLPKINFIEKVLELTEKYGFALFSEHCPEVEIERKGKKLKQTMASDKEKWYLLRCKALFMNKNYEACMVTCTEALVFCSRNNRVWVLRYRAKAYAFTGKTPMAQADYAEILKLKTDWYLYAELFEILAEQEPEKALVHAFKAFDSPAPPVMKLGFFEKTALFFEHRQKPEHAEVFWGLVASVRLKNGYKVPVRNGKLISVAVASDYNKLATKAGQILQPKASKTAGVISKILHPGKFGDGFITDAQGKSYYFKCTDIKNAREALYEKMPVSFEISVSEYKGTEKLVAVAIFILKE